MPKPTTFGKRIKDLRDDNKWSQSDLAEKSGVPAVMISHFETGVRQSASAATLVKLANAFVVSIDYLVGRSNDPKLVGGQVGALLRTLEGASASTLDSVLAIGKTLADRERADRERNADGSQREKADKRDRLGNSKGKSR